MNFCVTHFVRLFSSLFVISAPRVYPLRLEYLLPSVCHSNEAVVETAWNTKRYYWTTLIERLLVIIISFEKWRHWHRMIRRLLSNKLLFSLVKILIPLRLLYLYLMWTPRLRRASQWQLFQNTRTKWHSQRKIVQLTGSQFLALLTRHVHTLHFAP